jgi:hypothetical protein
MDALDFGAELGPPETHAQEEIRLLRKCARAFIALRDGIIVGSRVHILTQTVETILGELKAAGIDAEDAIVESAIEVGEVMG